MFVVTEEVHQPVVDWVGDIQQSHLADCVKGLAEIESQDHYKWVGGQQVSDCNIPIRAAVMDQVGRKAYWSSKQRVVGGERIDGYRKFFTTMRSKVLQRTGNWRDRNWTENLSGFIQICLSLSHVVVGLTVRILLCSVRSTRSGPFATRLSVCLSVRLSVTLMCCAQTTERIKLPFRVRVTPKHCDIIVLHGDPDPLK